MLDLNRSRRNSTGLTKEEIDSIFLFSLYLKTNRNDKLREIRSKIGEFNYLALCIAVKSETISDFEKKTLIPLRSGYVFLKSISGILTKIEEGLHQ